MNINTIEDWKKIILNNMILIYLKIYRTLIFNFS